METGEKAFYDALGIVPDVPDSILANVEERVRKVGTKRRIAIAACLLLTLVIPATVVRYMNSQTVYAAEYESIEELMAAFEFFSGEYDLEPLFDINNEIVAAETKGEKVAINGTADVPKGAEQ